MNSEWMRPERTAGPRESRSAVSSSAHACSSDWRSGTWRRLASSKNSHEWENYLRGPRGSQSRVEGASDQSEGTVRMSVGHVLDQQRQRLAEHT
jgi:hypothetical protein